MQFNEFGLCSELLQAVAESGYRTPTPIQKQAIPAILEDRDVLGGAQTGTGKTAAFALPLLEKLQSSDRKERRARVLVLTPTRELGEQVWASFQRYGSFLSLRIMKIYGGVNIKPQIAQLKRGVDIIVATPGRLLDLLHQNAADLSGVEHFVLDEADRMLDMGFIRDIQKIIRFLPEERQNLLFSATFEKEIRNLAKKILRDPVMAEVDRKVTSAVTVDQSIYKVDQRQKRFLLIHLIKKENWYRVLVFVRTKHGANRLAKQLGLAEIPASAIHGNKSQNARTRALESFKKGDLQVLVATDIAARGLHLEDLGHVVNFDLPQVPEDYVHRVGRTGRAGKTGTAYSLISPDEVPQLKKIEKILKKSLPIETADDFEPVNLPPAEKNSRPPRNASSGRSRSGNTHRKGNSGRSHSGNPSGSGHSNRNRSQESSASNASRTSSSNKRKRPPRSKN